jgi:hypothetical protein
MTYSSIWWMLRCVYLHNLLRIFLLTADFEIYVYNNYNKLKTFLAVPSISTVGSADTKRTLSPYVKVKNKLNVMRVEFEQVMIEEEEKVVKVMNDYT